MNRQQRTLGALAAFGVVLVAAYFLGFRPTKSQTPPVSVATEPAVSSTTASLAATPPTSSPRTAPTPFPSGASVAMTWAAACGTVSDYVGNTSSTNGSFVLNSPERSPLKVTLTPAHSPGGIFSGYVCASLEAGAPSPIFRGLFPPNTPGFINQGSFPATAAQPAPTGFVMPQACVFVAAPLVEALTTWGIDCGASANRDARGTLGLAFTQQGWSSCGVGLANATWMKGATRITVSEGSGAPGEYPKLTQPNSPEGSACP